MTTNFSRFFHEASSEERERVFRKVAEKAGEEQRKVLET